MTEKLDKIIKKEMENLPMDSQEVINSIDWVKISEEIGKKYLLDESELNMFQAQTALVLLGLLSPYLYATKIQDEIGIGEEEANKMAIEATDKIFIPVADTLEEKIKNKVRNKNWAWNQTLNFITSGGDYSVFLGTREMEISQKNQEPDTETESKVKSIKDSFVI